MVQASFWFRITPVVQQMDQKSVIHEIHSTDDVEPGTPLAARIELKHLTSSFDTKTRSHLVRFYTKQGFTY